MLYGQIYPEIQGARTLTCVYSGFTITLAAAPADPSTDAFNKGINTEHTFPQGLFSQNEPMRSDLHHLFPTREDVNNARGSDPFADIADAQTTRWYRLATSQTTIQGANLDEWSEDTGSNFEVREDHKGNTSRAIFYFNTMYRTIAMSFFEAMKATLRQWHTQDPADAAEIARSNAIGTASRQKTTNPYIDDATLVDRAYFSSGGGVQTATVVFSSATGTVVEGSTANVTVRVTTSDGAALGAAVSGQVTFTSGTANGADLSTTFPLAVSFSSGSASGSTQVLSFAAMNDGITEGTESATLALSGFSGATAGTPASLTLSVTEPGGGGGGGAGTFVISQFQVAGTTADDEFVEVLNVSGTSLDLNGYKLVYRSATGTSDVPIYEFTASRVVPAGGYLLVAHSGYDGSPARDLAFASGVGLSGSAGGIALRNGALNSGTIGDAVRYGTATNAFSEGTTNPAGPAANSSRARLGSGAQDTNDNNADFALLTPSVPRNSASPPLPVELTAFTASVDGQIALLRWTTESETNYAGFYIEQQSGHWNWTDAGFVAGRGTTSERSHYTYQVAGLMAGAYSFRLRQVDLDGTTSYSPVVEVVLAMEERLALSVRGMVARIAVREAQLVRVEAYDVLGRRVAVLLDAAMVAGETRDVSLEASGLAAGLYVLRATGAHTGATRLIAIP